MRSERPKPLHRLCGRPMVLHVLDALAELDLDRAVVVVGHGAERVTKALARAAAARPRHRLRRAARPAGDRRRRLGGPHRLPRRRSATMTATSSSCPATPRCCGRPPWPPWSRHHRGHDAAATVLTARLTDPTGYGRVVRGKDGRVARIVEAGRRHRRGAGRRRDQHLDLRVSPLRAGARPAPPVARTTPRVSTTSPTRSRSSTTPGTRSTALVVDDPMEAAGVNDRAQLAVAEAELRDRINERWMRRGVTMVDPERHLPRHHRRARRRT